MQAFQDERDDALSKLEKTDSAAIERKTTRKKLEKDIRKELEKEIRAEMKENYGSGRTSTCCQEI